MSYLEAAIAVVGVLSLLNLALIFAVIRQIRGHAEQLDKLPRFGRPPRLPVGSKAPDITVTTVIGEKRSLGPLTSSRTLVGFMSPSCEPCRVQAPEFASFAKTIPGGAAHVVAVLIGEEKEVNEFSAEFLGAASLVIEAPNGDAARAFSEYGMPFFYIIDSHGRIEASGHRVNGLISTPVST